MEITLNVHFHLPPALMRLVEQMSAPVAASTDTATPRPTEGNAASTPSEAPKRRGRPPKVPTAEPSPALVPPSPALVPPAPAPEAPPTAATAPSYTPKDLAKILQETMALVGVPRATSVFTKLKVGRIVDLKPEQYPDFVRHCFDAQAQFLADQKAGAAS